MNLIEQITYVKRMTCSGNDTYNALSAQVVDATPDRYIEVFTYIRLSLSIHW